MDDEQYAAARERLERDYISGAIDAEEYTRLRRQLHETGALELEAARQEQSHGWDAERATADDPPIGFRRLPFDPDPVTGAPLASWGRRAGAWFVDALVYVGAIVAVVLWSTTTEDPRTGEPSDFAALLTSVTIFLGPTLYQWLTIGRWGQTLGKMAVGIVVVRSQDAGRVSYPRALGRAASVLLLGLLLLPILLAYLWPLWDRRNQTIYDKMASTIVVTRE